MFGILRCTVICANQHKLNCFFLLKFFVFNKCLLFILFIVFRQLPPFYTKSVLLITTAFLFWWLLPGTAPYLPVVTRSFLVTHWKNRMLWYHLDSNDDHFDIINNSGTISLPLGYATPVQLSTFINQHPRVQICSTLSSKEPKNRNKCSWKKRVFVTIVVL